MGRSKRLIELIAQKEGLMSDRQTNWHIVPVSLPLLFNPSLENSKLRIMINQVVILLLYWVAISEGAEIQTTMNSVLIKSSIPTIELISHTEEIELTIFDDFFKQTKKLSQQIEILANFQTNPTCSTQGVAEDIGTVLHSNLTKRIIGNIRISHVEQKMEKMQYIAWYNKNCFFALNKEFRKSIQNFDRHVTQGKTLSATRKLLVKNFIDQTGSDCLIHGKYPQNYYFKSIKLNSIVDCALTCYNMFERAIRREILGSILAQPINETCNVYSFNIITGSCLLAQNMNNTIFRSLNDYKGTNVGFVSGKQQCQYKDLGLNPGITYNNSVIQLNNVCDYKIKQPIQLNSRCMKKYYQLMMPLDLITNELNFFLTRLKLKLTSNNRTKRNIVQLSSAIIKFLAKQLLKSGNDKIHSEIILNVKHNTVLFNIANTYHNMGFQETSLTKNSITSILTTEIKLKQMENMTNNKFKDKYHIEKEIKNLTTWANKIKTRFEQLLFPQPSTNETIKFVGNDTYLFNIWISNKKIIRKFIKETTAKYNAKQLSYIPINEMYFDNTKWMQHTFVMGNKNDCLKALLNGDLRYCTDNKSTRQIITDNIYFVNHQYSINSGKIITFNTPGVLETKCLQNRASLIKNVKGLTIILITDDCVVFFNHILLIKAQNNITGMEPVIAYEGLQFATKTKVIAVHTFINSGLIGLGMSVTILVGVIYYKKKRNIAK